jgi:hypothetical protein
MGHKVRKGERFETQVNTHEIIQLEYKNMDFLSHTTTAAVKKSCSLEMSFDDCMYGTVAGTMKKNTNYGCTVPWMKDNENICTSNEDMNTTFWIGWNRITNQENDCLPPCHTTIINTGARNYQKNSKNLNSSTVYLYFSSTVIKSEECYLYSVLKLIGQIGGYLGLYRLFLWILDLCKFNRLVETKEQNKRKSSLSGGGKEAGGHTASLASLGAIALDGL